jgi:hypothetical protein
MGDGGWPLADGPGRMASGEAFAGDLMMLLYQLL